MLFANNYASVKGKSQHLSPGLPDNIGKAMGPASQTEVGLGRVKLVHLKATHGSLSRSMLGNDSLPCLLPLPDLQNCPLSPSHLATPKVLEIPFPTAGPWTMLTMLPCPHGSLPKASRGHSFPFRSWNQPGQHGLFCLL